MSLANFDERWDYNDPAGTEVIFRAMLDEIAFKDHPEYHLELKTQIARTLGLQQKYRAGHTLLDEVEQALTPAYTIARIRYLLERGRIYNSAQNPELSLSFFMEAWELGLKEGADYYAVDAAHMMGTAASPDVQLEWNEKAVELAEKSQDPRAKEWLGSLYNNIGWTYHGNGEFNKALDAFNKTYDWYASKNDLKFMQIAKWSAARTHRSLGNIDIALEMQTTLARDMATSGEEDGYVYEEIAECFQGMGEPEKARPYFLKAWKILSQDPWLQQNESERLERLNALGQPAP
ncbi:MAG: tetratricopeptide repeat protein [Candidatus Marinimicrobia bacterium]|nr:tetratricopeptide repeat protein [Candidatus Neomarinimicrobiota bacterium]MCF7850605.1 tetratricopeptide repeat protein [Candidatus Neomarinimicrobiota bacterium]MCF7903661.1 tetratricopeptide repeat protein [Candidatus Neomarinimicrobiota bacterium]